jgi:hypothetical protein
LLEGVENGADTVEYNMVILHKIKNRTIIWSSDFTSGYKTKDWKQEYELMFAHVIATHIIHWWKIDQQNGTHTYDEYYLTLKRKFWHML